MTVGMYGTKNGGQRPFAGCAGVPAGQDGGGQGKESGRDPGVDPFGSRIGMHPIKHEKEAVFKVQPLVITMGRNNAYITPRGEDQAVQAIA
jgi:hypothetical protein